LSKVDQVLAGDDGRSESAGDLLAVGRAQSTLLNLILDDQIGLIVVKGDSGAGKTSVLRAALPGLLAKQVPPIAYHYWEAIPEQAGNGSSECRQIRMDREPRAFSFASARAPCLACLNRSGTLASPAAADQLALCYNKKAWVKTSQGIFAQSTDMTHLHAHPFS